MVSLFYFLDWWFRQECLFLDFLFPKFLFHKFLFPKFLFHKFLFQKFLIHKFLIHKFLIHKFLNPRFFVQESQMNFQVSNQDFQKQKRKKTKFMEAIKTTTKIPDFESKLNDVFLQGRK